MKNPFKNKPVLYSVILAIIIIAGISIIALSRNVEPVYTHKTHEVEIDPADYPTLETLEEFGEGAHMKEYADSMPVYGNWRTFTKKDGLPDDKCYTVRIDGDRVLVGTHHGLAVYQKGKWKTYTTEDGLAHNGIVSIDVSALTGDAWLGTLGGLNRWSGGKFETFNQFNSGMPNDLVYNVFCYGKDVWVATGGGAGHYDTQTKEWEIFTEQNAPMHEPWTYACSAGEGKVWIAAWGGGVIEYNMRTKHFRDYVDPDGFMEIDLLPNDGVVHDITTATTYGDSIFWVATYFGMSRYDGKNWNGYFDHDSGLASNFINFVRAEGPVVYICCDNGFSTFNGKTWITYKKFDNSVNGVAKVMKGTKVVKEIPLEPSISHNFTIGVDVQDDVIWIATSKGLCRGERIM
jgi:ligand-binding sensor domain-containing protein